MLAKLGEAKAERLVFAPGEVPHAFQGDRSWPLDGARVRAATLMEALSEILSQDELESIPSNRARIVRHEHEGAHYVIEVARENGAVQLAVRHAKPTLRKESIREAPQAPPRKAEKRTVRVDLDDEGNMVESEAAVADLGRRQTIPRLPTPESTRASNEAAKRDTKQVKRASRAAMNAARRAHQTIVIPPKGTPANNAVISGDPNGAHITFLYAPGGFALESTAGVVTATPDHAVVRGELYVPPSMKLRVLQGTKESIVSYYRTFD
jgi:hypothetical protein